AFGSTTLATWESACPATSGGVTVCYGWCSCDCYNGSYSITLKGAAFVGQLADAGPDLGIFSQNRNGTVIQGTSVSRGSYSWLEDNYVLDSGFVGDNGECPLDLGAIAPLETGFHTLTLEVSDPQGVCSDDMKLMIEDPEAPSEPEEPGLAPVARTGQADIYAAGDDGTLQMGVESPDPRFTDNQDGTVTDNLTGLIWLKNAYYLKTEKTWNEALTACAVLADDGVTLTDGSAPGDWRLPNPKELLSLVDYYSVGYVSSKLPAGHPFDNARGATYWTGTTYNYYNSTSRAFQLSSNDGRVFPMDKTNRYRIWPVRGGQGGSAPVAKSGQTEIYGCHDDGILQKGVKWPDPRFTDNQDGTVTDNLTGLIWLKRVDRFRSIIWSQALSTCNDLQADGVTLTDGSVPGDWRLPNIKELSSLVDYGQAMRLLPPGNPFTGSLGVSYYFSSTTDTFNSTKSLGVSFYNGSVSTCNKTSISYKVWPVRGPKVVVNEPPTPAPEP
ncbi:MAG: DUF1566 domain-containing protein, partial [Desulfobulbaceae bacterium]|nr:DUF1566 domain-containing protein [Desulfobulbaceae bacterium]